MKIKIGTITELTGEGYEILVDTPTRTIVLAKLFNGVFIREIATAASSDEETPVLSATA